MCLKIVSFDPKTGKISSEKRQCKPCMAEGRSCKSRSKTAHQAQSKRQAHSSGERSR